MKKSQFTNDVNTDENMDNQFINAEDEKIDFDDQRKTLEKLDLTNNFSTDYYTTFR